MDITSDRLQLVEIVRKWGEVNTDGLLDKKTSIFSIPEIEGVIGYRIELRNAIVYGDPVCALENKIALAQAFEKYCRSKNIQVIYAIASEEFANLATEHLSFSLIEFGKKFVLDPLNYMDLKAPLLRKKIRQSSRNGINIQEYTSNNLQIEQAMEQLAIAWVQERKGIQIYLAGPNLFSDALGKRWFYAEREGKIIGFVLLNKLQSHDGWLLNNVMVAKDAPSGVSEHLIVSALQILAKEECRFVLIGPVPAAQLGRMIGLRQIIVLIARWSFKVIRKISRLGGHEIFWEKFQPTIRSAYLLFPKNRFRLSSVLALFRALNISLR